MDHAVSPALDRAQEEVVEEMAGLEDHLEKYRYLVELGRRLDSPDGIRSEEHAVPGCQNRVWLRAELRDGRLRLFADSDALITRGIIALLLRVLDGRPPAEVVDAELYFLEETGLASHLSPSRANGLTAMVKRIRRHAGEHLERRRRGADGGVGSGVSA
ncbi:MAG: SufE family protein [Gemmatimonadota bacterium]